MTDEEEVIEARKVLGDLPDLASFDEVTAWSQRHGLNDNYQIIPKLVVQKTDMVLETMYRICKRFNDGETFTMDERATTDQFLSNVRDVIEKPIEEL